LLLYEHICLLKTLYNAVCRLLLATESNYFRKRLEDWDSDPWTMTGADGKPLLVAGVEEPMWEAAQQVIQLMYEGVVPSELKPTQIAKAGGRSVMSIVCTVVSKPVL
jgi:hypothetical protein